MGRGRESLARLGIEPSVIAGASIGAVNGAVVAGSADIKTAAEDLELV